MQGLNLGQQGRGEGNLANRAALMNAPAKKMEVKDAAEAMQIFNNAVARGWTPVKVPLMFAKIRLAKEDVIRPANSPYSILQSRQAPAPAVRRPQTTTSRKDNRGATSIGAVCVKCKVKFANADKLAAHKKTSRH